MLPHRFLGIDSPADFLLRSCGFVAVAAVWFGHQNGVCTVGQRRWARASVMGSWRGLEPRAAGSSHTFDRTRPRRVWTTHLAMHQACAETERRPHAKPPPTLYPSAGRPYPQPLVPAYICPPFLPSPSIPFPPLSFFSPSLPSPSLPFYLRTPTLPPPPSLESGVVSLLVRLLQFPCHWSLTLPHSPEANIIPFFRMLPCAPLPFDVRIPTLPSQGFVQSYQQFRATRRLSCVPFHPCGSKSFHRRLRLSPICRYCLLNLQRVPTTCLCPQVEAAWLLYPSSSTRYLLSASPSRVSVGISHPHVSPFLSVSCSPTSP